ncbi:MAG: Flp pilus assembly protein CpaB [Rhodopirellula sp.]|nr:Flp pilus assembly protein CpaB [Rhodopirellula sp.]
MRMRTVLIGAFALVFGISAAVGVYLIGNSAPETLEPETVSVIVAAIDINRGQTLTAEQLTKLDWPKELVPEGAITVLDDVLERTVAIPILKGDLLLDGKLAVKGSGHGMAAVIPAGMRAVTIQTPNVATGVAGFILPGNKVDVLLTMSSQGAADETGGGSTITLLQNLEILAVDQRTDVPEDNRMDSNELRSVTLLVTPAEAARLDLGQNKGTLRLTLRNPTDEATEFVEPVTLTELKLNPSEIVPERTDVPPPVTAQVETPIAARPRKVAPQIRTLRGTRSGLIEFPAPIDEPTDSTVEPVTSTVEPVTPLVTSAP